MNKYVTPYFSTKFEIATLVVLILVHDDRYIRKFEF